jgi:predicted phage-related endonuclease
MANDRSDFAPEKRRAKLWSGDSRRIAKGDIAGVVLEKLGRVDAPDILHVEAVQMGHRLQPVVARIFEEHHDIKLRELDVAIEHKTEAYVASHFDYEFEDRSALVECKAYNANMAQYFSEQDEEPIRVPPADWAQCCHEALVYGTDTVYLAVLFGGQRFRSFKLTFTSEQKTDWLKKLAEAWGMIQAGNVPDATTPEAARATWPTSTDDEAVATAAVEHLCAQLAQYKAQMKKLEEYSDAAIAHLQNYMRDKGSLVDPSGKILATWKTAKGVKRFDQKSFESAMPDIYKQFLREQPGSRRFLIKS